MYKKIISLENISEAYFDVVEKMEETRRSHKYSGFDAKVLGSYDFFSESLLKEIQIELTNANPITPALEMEIPKRTKLGTRLIYIHTIKERIKSQAVYRVVEPVFDSYFSKYLFSYRSSHPHYKAIRTVVRRYHKNNNEHVLIGDISSYSDIINPNILKEQIKLLNFDEMTNNLLFLYVDMQFLQNGIKKKSEKGIITGLPVTVMFNNLYLDIMDKKIGDRIDLYRRVGDDFIAFGSYEALVSMKKQMVDILLDLKIPIESQKINLQKVSDSFSFLGYLFNNSLVSILPFSAKQIQKKMRLKLKFYEFSSIKDKRRKLKEVLFAGESIQHDFIQIVRQYNHSSDINQMKFLSDYFIKRLVIYFFGSYTPRNHRELRKITSHMKIPSLLKYYVAFQTGSHSGKDLKKIK